MVKNIIAIILMVLMIGCVSGRLMQPLEWASLSDFTPSDLRAIFGHEPHKLLTGDEAPFDGFLIAGADYQAWKARDARLLEEIKDLKGQIRDDRDYSSQVHMAVTTGLEECRKNQPRVFAAGVGVGAGGCAILDRLVDQLQAQ